MNLLFLLLLIRLVPTLFVLGENQNLPVMTTLMSGVLNGSINLQFNTTRAVVLIIKDLKYTDNGNFEISFNPKDKSEKIKSHISLTVFGGPEVKDLSYAWLMDEYQLRQKFNLTFEGNPLPIVTFSLANNSHYENLTKYADIQQTDLNFYTSVYTITFSSRKVARKLNGLSVNFTAKGYNTIYDDVIHLNVTWGPEFQYLNKRTVIDKEEAIVTVTGNPLPRVSASFAEEPLSLKYCQPCGQHVCQICINLTRFLNRENCGKLLHLKAWGANTRQDNQNVSIYFSFTPALVNISSFVKQENSYKLTITPEDTGDCRLSYEYQLTDNGSIFHQATTTEATIVVVIEEYHANVTASVRAVWQVAGNASYSAWASVIVEELKKKIPEDPGNKQTKLIIGLSVGGVLVLVALITPFILWIKRKKK